jgi:hypothetical protein
MRLQAATPRVLALSVRMATWIVVVSILVRITSLARVQRIVSRRLRAHRRVPGGRLQGDATDLARTIDRLLCLDRLMFQRCCWKRALVLHRFLALRGISSRVMFGVRRDADGTMRGHAWLEHEGRPLFETETVAGYVVTFSLPGAPQLS